MHRWNWDDLRLVLAVGEHKSLASAARALGVNHTTVLRRINAFEKLQGLRLFDRLPSGYALTDAGEKLLVTAREMSDVVRELERKLTGQDLRLEGSLRVTTCDTLMGSLLPSVISKFREKHPQISLELSTGSFVSNLAQRHADVAIRTGDKPDETLIGRKVTDVGFALYAAEGYSLMHDLSDTLSHQCWLSPDETLAGMGISKWLNKTIPESSIVLKGDSVITLRQAAVAGLGIVPLPCYLGDSSRGLERLTFNPFDKMKTGLWILSHSDLRHTARVRAFTSFAAKELLSTYENTCGKRIL